MYWVMWDGDEAGLYKNNEMVLDWRELLAMGYRVSYIAGWTSRQLERITDEKNS